eukprot:3029976-Amphidinium_carterae.1
MLQQMHSLHKIAGICAAIAPPLLFFLHMKFIWYGWLDCPCASDQHHTTQYAVWLRLLTDLELQVQSEMHIVGIGFGGLLVSDRRSSIKALEEGFLALKRMSCAEVFSIVSTSLALVPLVQSQSWNMNSPTKPSQHPNQPEILHGPIDCKKQERVSIIPRAVQ